MADTGEKEFDLKWDGRRCYVKPLTAKPSQTIALKIVNLVGSGLKEAGAAGDAQAADLITIGAVMERLDQPTIDLMTREFVRVTAVETVAGSQTWIKPDDVQDLVFAGGPGLARWMRWLAFCLEMSCGDFFEELRALSKARSAAKTPSASPSPTT